MARSDEELFPLETAAQFRSNDRRALESESSLQTIETLKQADAVVHHSIVNKFAIPGGTGRAAMVGGIAIDITELKQRRKSCARVKNAIAPSSTWVPWPCIPVIARV